MRTGLALALIMSAVAVLADAEEMSCESDLIRVTGPRTDLIERACDTAKNAEAIFSQCNVGPLSEPILISIVEELDPGCVAQYHCGEGWIEVLPPAAMAERRSPEDAFGFLAVEDYFDSVIVHELAHAAYDGLPCPYQTCLATNEYVAYAMQVMSLSSEDQLAFAANSGLDRRITTDELNVMILFLAPDMFARKAWAHLSQQDEPCELIGKIANGAVYFDRDMP